MKQNSDMFYAVRVGDDSTGPHLEYYETEEDYGNGMGYPVDELEAQTREYVLLDILNGLYAPSKGLPNAK